ncbi:hypothetical protein FQA47_012487 [Oryzias melastigma]|uniref:Uncharacterized protein n=1 Tax=Oryzias melastigma TaxID=30732 RepID=A0A834CDS4_ORYME|nr:hypothetical protein FQA47_012487 [Oryzias melastigma]
MCTRMRTTLSSSHSLSSVHRSSHLLPFHPHTCTFDSSRRIKAPSLWCRRSVLYYPHEWRTVPQFDKSDVALVARRRRLVKLACLILCVSCEACQSDILRLAMRHDVMRIALHIASLSVYICAEISPQFGST